MTRKAVDRCGASARRAVGVECSEEAALAPTSAMQPPHPTASCSSKACVRFALAWTGCGLGRPSARKELLAGASSRGSCHPLALGGTGTHLVAAAVAGALVRAVCEHGRDGAESDDGERGLHGPLSGCQRGIGKVGASVAPGRISPPRFGQTRSVSVTGARNPTAPLPTVCARRPPTPRALTAASRPVATPPRFIK